MRLKYVWAIALVVVALLVAACGPQMATPTPSDKEASEDSSGSGMAQVKTPTVEVVEEEPATEEPKDEEPASTAELPVDEGDWHVLGSPDAPVTIYEYSDFQ